MRRSPFYVLLTVAMIGLAILGFWPSYFGRLASGGVQRHWVIHLHGLVFSGWMALLLTQTLLVYRGRTPLHRKLGRIGIGWGIAVLVMGLIATVAAPVMHVRAGEWTLDQAAGFLVFPVGDMILWAGLFTAAIAYRRKPEIHKRLILLATVALLFAPAARFAGAMGPAAMLAVWLFPVALGVGFDLWSRRRVHPVYGIGTLALLAFFPRIFLEKSELWLPTGRAIMRAFGAA